MIDEFSKCEKHTGAVAFLDLLGFSDRTQNISLENARDEIVIPLIKTALLSKNIINDDLRYFNYGSVFNYFYFSDSIIFYMPIQSNSKSYFSTPESVLKTMCYACALTVAKSIWLNIPIRGAIAYGEIMVCKNPLYFLGKPFLEAHKLEKKQKWAGVALCQSAEKYVNPEDNPRVVRWDVPIKNGKENYIVVNWPGQSQGPSLRILKLSEQKRSTTEEGPTPDWASCFKIFDEDNKEEILNKRKFTEEFFNIQNPKGTYGITFGPNNNGR